MKKIIPAILILTALIISPIIVFSNTNISIDDPFTIDDVLEILKDLAGLHTLTDEQIQLYDIDKKGNIDIGDALEILKMLAGLRDFPPPPPPPETEPPATTAKTTPEPPPTTEEPPVIEPPPAPQVPEHLQQMADELVELINLERSDEGVKALADNHVGLNAAAMIRAQERVGFNSHDRPCGREWFTILDEFGINHIGASESVVEGANTPDWVIEKCMEEDDLRGDVLNKKFTHIGVGVGVDEYDDTFYWVILYVRLDKADFPAPSTPAATDTFTDDEPPATSDEPDSITMPPSLQAKADEVVDLVNEERAKQDLPPLTADNTNLSNAAIIRAQEIVTNFSHERPDGRECFTVLLECDVKYRYCGENIAKGQTSAQEVVDDWMDSYGHRMNILNVNYTQISIGLVNRGGTHYWVQLFI